MVCSKVLRPVFIDTNLGTRIVVPVSPDITAKEFKRELENVHLNCFPEVGNIRVNGLMVKKKSCYYHLSESFPLKYAFQSSNDNWFLQCEVYTQSIDGTEVLNCNSAYDVSDSVKYENISSCINKSGIECKRKKSKMLSFFAVVCLSKRKKKRKRVKPKYKTGTEVNWSLQKLDSRSVEETSSETLSESISVSGIIKKYFSDYDDVASPQSGYKSSNVWLKKPNSEALIEKRKKPEVGKRFLVACNNLGLTPTNQRPEVSVCKLSNGRSPVYKPSDVVRNLVFEITE
ncbi:hypothetical protein ACJIZ3_013010 [Penstemon smallii]|uniref:Uncharacterized protein n=1 Tax=Penstemon smallii TaxID=265156 RepID=A0ABD3URU9_9LAMI